MSYQSKYTIEEQKIARDIYYILVNINQAKTEKTRRKYIKIKNKLIKKLKGKYGSGVIKLKTTKSEAHTCIKKN